MATPTPVEPAPAPAVPCPDALARAPRAAGPAPTDALLHLPVMLHGAAVALVWRDARGTSLGSEQRITHFPASPLLSLSWFQGAALGLLRPHEDGTQWQAFDAAVMVSGSQSRPLASWTPGHGHGGMLCFTAEQARVLFGIDPGQVVDRLLPAAQVMAGSWQPMFDALLAAPDELATLAALREHLAPRWQQAQGRRSTAPSLSHWGRHWVERLAWLAHDWRRTHSGRQVERRIKRFSGRSLRDWQSLVRTEGAFFAARQRHEAGLPFDWAGLALEQGFADQAHFVRATRRITGFAPGEFADRFLHDESFWLYRLWV